jgi:dTDP-4-amino-4,6-dideoxygalactose transaminase
MINLFHINNHQIDTKDFSNLLHDETVVDFENIISEYVGAKYAVSLNSATSAIFLCLLNKHTIIKIPSIIPPVVPNAILTSHNQIKFYDNTEWVGDSYVLHDFGPYKIIDSAQKLEHNQFAKECNDQDLMIFSFYPTKPIGSCDGGMIVSNDINKINHLKEQSLNGMSYAKNNWDRVIKFPGYKMYMNSVQAALALNNFRNYSIKLEKLDAIRSFYNHKLHLVNKSNHLYTIRVHDNKKFVDFMRHKGIICGIHYNSLHNHAVYKQSVHLPLSEDMSKTTVSIPFHEQLTKDELNYIVKSINEYK